MGDNMGKKTFFDFLYSATSEAISAIQKPGRVKMLNRAADRARDELEKLKIDAELERANLFKRLAKDANEDEANKIYKQLADKAREIQEAEEMANLVGKVRDELFGEYVPPKGE
jgi:RNA polymerase-interacting CarD/CdnL/TRCF family regulator